MSRIAEFRAWMNPMFAFKSSLYYNEAIYRSTT